MAEDFNIGRMKAEAIAKAFGIDVEKGHEVGDIHPNGKWVWTQLPSGKYDWRVRNDSSKSSDEEKKQFTRLLQFYPNDREIRDWDKDKLKRFLNVAIQGSFDTRITKEARERHKKWSEAIKLHIEIDAKNRVSVKTDNYRSATKKLGRHAPKMDYGWKNSASGEGTERYINKNGINVSDD